MQTTPEEPRTVRAEEAGIRYFNGWLIAGLVAAVVLFVFVCLFLTGAIGVISPVAPVR